MSRNFSLAEAQTMLPVLEALLRRAQDSGAVVARCETGMQELSQQIFLSGGMRVDVTVVARRRAERDKAAQGLKDALAEIDAIGVGVEDMNEGVLDFPSLLDGSPVLLCWKLGEGEIRHWHGADEGFEDRQTLDGRIRGSKIDRLN